MITEDFGGGVTIDSYKEAVGAFSRGEMFFEDLQLIVSQLPSSPFIANDSPVGNESLAELYLRTEGQYGQMLPPNSLNWLAMLRDFGDITDKQYEALLRVAGQHA